MSDPRVLRRLAGNPVALLSAFTILVVSLACLLGPWFLPETLADPSTNQYLPPSWAHPFGTDLNGRDVLYRVLAGGRISIVVGVCGAIVSLVIGTAWGLIAGYAGGRIDAVMMRVVDVLYSVPRLIFILIAINAFNTQVQAWASHLGWDFLVQFSRIVILIITFLQIAVVQSLKELAMRMN